MSKRFFIKLISCFIPFRKKRRAFRNRYLKRKVSENSPIMQNQIDINVDIGKHTYVCPGTRIFQNTSIGKFCSIATDVTIGASAHPTDFLSTHPFQYCSLYLGNEEKYTFETFPKTVIGNDVWIGCHAIIKCGVKIGDGAIIGSGAVITKDIPPYAIVVGVPGKILRYRFNEEIRKKLQGLQWWNFPEDKIKNLPFADVKKCIEILENGEKNVQN